MLEHIDDRFQQGAVIDREEVRFWLHTGDLEVRGCVLDALERPRLAKQVEPGMSAQELHSELINYGLECVAHYRHYDEDSEWAWSPFDAAHALVRLFERCARTRDKKLARDLLTRIAEMIKLGDPQLCRIIETGFLEHALEPHALRPWFAGWESDPDLAAAIGRCIDWADAHAR